MIKIAVAVVASALAGLAVGAWIIGDRAPGTVAATSAGVYPDSDAPLIERVQRLERVIAEERSARLVLEDELLALLAQIERLESVPGSAQVDRAARVESADVVPRTSNRAAESAARFQNQKERRAARLIEGGFSEDEAQRLVRQESEAQYKALQAYHDIQRSGDAAAYGSSQMNTQSILRQDLGDSDYERYLEAQGQRTAVRISNVLDGSPGSEAGLQAGDEIVSYNGARTFSMIDIRELTQQGDPGENVVVEIDRDGVRMQLSIPRGPIGMSGSGALERGIGRWGG